MRSMQQQLGVLGTISAFTYRYRETKKNLCRRGWLQDLPDTDFQPAIWQLKYVRQQYTHSKTIHMRKQRYTQDNTIYKRPTTFRKDQLQLIGCINVIILLITVACLFAQGLCFRSTHQNILVLTGLCFSGLCQFHSSFCAIVICVCFIALNYSRLFAMTMILLLVDLSLI